MAAPGTVHISQNDVQIDLTCDDTQKKINILTKRKNEYIMSLGNMMCQNYPISLSFIPHPLCNWQIQRVNSLQNDITLLQESITLQL
jgi:hypothetical protein